MAPALRQITSLFAAKNTVAYSYNIYIVLIGNYLTRILFS